MVKTVKMIMRKIAVIVTSLLLTVGLSACAFHSSGAKQSYTETFDTDETQSYTETFDTDEESAVESETVESEETQSYTETFDTDEESDVESETVESEETQSYTVTFDTVGGTVVESQTVDLGEKVQKPEDPHKSDSKHDYIFEGWYLGDRKWNFEKDTVSGDITLTARWAIDGEYTNPFLPSD